MSNEPAVSHERFVTAICVVVIVVGWMSALLTAGKLTYYVTSEGFGPPQEWSAFAVFSFGTIITAWMLANFRRELKRATPSRR